MKWPPVEPIWTNIYYIIMASLLTIILIDINSGKGMNQWSHQSFPVEVNIHPCLNFNGGLTYWGRDKNGRHFPDGIFKCFFFKENVSIAIKISLKFVLKGTINNIPALVQIMAWRRPGDKPLSEPMMVSLPSHICVTRPQWVNCTAFVLMEWINNNNALFDVDVITYPCPNLNASLTNLV